MDLQGPSPRLPRAPSHLGSQRLHLLPPLHRSSPAPIPSAVEGVWGQGELSPRGAAVDGLIHSWWWGGGRKGEAQLCDRVGLGDLGRTLSRHTTTGPFAEAALSAAAWSLLAKWNWAHIYEEAASTLLQPVSEARGEWGLSPRLCTLGAALPSAGHLANTTLVPVLCCPRPYWG